MSWVRKVVPSVPIGGTTSFRGIFTEDGFRSGIGMLIAEQSDSIRTAMSLKPTGLEQATHEARAACVELQASLGQVPHLVLMHASPGTEERILEGIRAELGADVPVYGGTAADNDAVGLWSVFADGRTCGEGFVLIGLCSAQSVNGAFLAGYLPTEHMGTVTRVTGRTVHEIDRLPAALVYNKWARNILDPALARGGSLLGTTNLAPVARTVGASLGLPRRILSHPHEVANDGKSLRFFTEFNLGDQVTLMTATPDSLIARVRRILKRAKGQRKDPIHGALLIYCAGCLSILLGRACEIVDLLKEELPGVPFLGIATYGEQGCFFDKTESYHGNLMCSVVLF